MHIAGSVGVEADGIAFVVDAVQHGAIRSLGIINWVPFAVRRVVGDAVGCAARINVEADGDSAIVDAKKLGYGSVRYGESDCLATCQRLQEAKGPTGNIGEKTADQVVGVDAGSGIRSRAAYGDWRELACLLTVGVAMGRPVGIVVEAHGDVGGIDAQQLVDLGRARDQRVVDAQVCEPIRQPDETEVRIASGIGGGPETNRGPVVCDAGRLRLHGGRKIVRKELGVGGRDGVTLVRMARGAAAIIARDDAVGVDAKQLVERGICRIVDGGERGAAISCKCGGAEQNSVDDDGNELQTKHWYSPKWAPGSRSIVR